MINANEFFNTNPGRIVFKTRVSRMTTCVIYRRIVIFFDRAAFYMTRGYEE